jgi:hypothetical protein
MSTRQWKGAISACLVALMTSASVLPAAAQGQYQGQSGGYSNPPPPPGNGYGPPPGNGYGPPPSGGPGDEAPPQGQYAEPPPGYDQGGGEYADQEQQQDAGYADAYGRWAATNCVNQANNTAAGALIGGILGAGIGAAVSRNPGRGAAIGGAIGLGTGAVAGASYGAGACPPGYAMAAGAPVFAYPGYVAWAPGWYRPWVWAGGRWSYHPYRDWYWNHNSYWRPGWRGRGGHGRRWR